jgi:hypothetical protein
LLGYSEDEPPNDAAFARAYACALDALYARRVACCGTNSRPMC